MVQLFFLFDLIIQGIKKQDGTYRGRVFIPSVAKAVWGQKARWFQGHAVRKTDVRRGRFEVICGYARLMKRRV